MVRKGFRNQNLDYLKSLNYDKYLRKLGLGKEDHYFWKQVGKSLLCTYVLFGAAWLYNKTSPLGKMVGTMIGPKGIIRTNNDSVNYQKQLQDQKFEHEAMRMWIRMRNEVI
ncbi:hypothetical protein K2173_013023 [Erythroxylum novogranatense]|uniref:Uncharacterized protein n=1 Tax=Erythroxylum novogranatense TaxID=1862640 RepID=A0AAV8S6K2_9ROSI|nr:hypothetical protein K2173_013023 [Erythroxylum novogranatense]